MDSEAETQDVPTENDPPGHTKQWERGGTQTERQPLQSYETETFN